MSKLKALTVDEFKELYAALPVMVLAKELDIGIKPLWKRAKKYDLPAKPMGRPHENIVFKGEETGYPPRIKELIVKSLIGDGVPDCNIVERGYDIDFIDEVKEKYFTKIDGKWELNSTLLFSA